MNLSKISAFDREEGLLNVIIETPKGSRNKFDYDTDRGLFKLGGPLPAGMEFPYHFGFVPSTLGGDGDPLDDPLPSHTRASIENECFGFECAVIGINPFNIFARLLTITV